jgi:DNA protecting protein DprA
LFVVGHQVQYRLNPHSSVLTMCDEEGEAFMDTRGDKATYLYALSHLPGIGTRGIRRIALAFSDPWQVLEAHEDELSQRLGRKMAHTLCTHVNSLWPEVWKSSVQMTQRHREHGVQELTVADDSYPPLLTSTSDFPVILYVKGNLTALQQVNTVAVVGTRDPTPTGSTMAREIAQYFATQGYAIVSGLAQGIDTAAHQGALDADGTTVAIVATALDTVYPTENTHLVKTICAEGGAIVSEYPFGQGGFKGAFVERDRIQAGMSLATIVVQTPTDGGAMHTARFAQRYGRLVLCPQPPDSETTAPENTGVLELLRQNRAQPFVQPDNGDLHHRLQRLKHTLLQTSV